VSVFIRSTLRLLRLVTLRARARGRLVAARDVRVARGVRVRVAPGARVLLEPGAALGPGARIEALGGTVRIARGARVGERAVLVSHTGLEVGERALIGDWAALDGGAPTLADVELPVRAQPLRRAPLTIGAGAVVGPHAVIGPGARVAAGARVEPYAVLPAPAREAATSAS
jgi:acetyltransferase-like isoleucine patch superfamily enzyme